MSEITVRDEKCENCAKFSHCNNNDLVCISRFQQLKAENEKLSTQNYYLDEANLEFAEENENYLQCLDEIEKYCKICKQGRTLNIETILQLIKQAKKGE